MAFKYGTIVTTDATTTVLLRVPLQAKRLQRFEIDVEGYNDANADSAVFRLEGAVKTDTTGAASLVGTPTVAGFTDARAAAWTATATVSTSYLVISAVGAAGTTVKWTPIKADVDGLPAPPPTY